MMIAHYLGIKPKTKVNDEEREQSMEELINTIGSGVVNVGKIQGGS